MQKKIRMAARMVLGAVAVSVACIGSAVLAPSSPAPAFAFLCLAFAALAMLSGSSAILAGIGVGALELALILPGEGFAVSKPDDALGLIGVIAAGLLIAWRTNRSDRRVEMLEGELRLVRVESRSAATLLDELSHRVSNDFTTLVSLASIRARHVEGEEARAALNDISGRMIVLGRVYRRLRVVGHAGGHMDADAFLAELCHDLQQSTLGLRPLALRLEIEPIPLPLGQLVIVGLIVNELLTNVYKHAFPDDRPGETSIELGQHVFRRDRVQLIVRDNGVGFVKYDGDDSHLGRRLIASLAAQLRGDVSYTRVDGQTIATLTFPHPDGKIDTAATIGQMVEPKNSDLAPTS